MTETAPITGLYFILSAGIAALRSLSYMERI